MNKTVKIIGIDVLAGILAFFVFGIFMYSYADNIFNKMFGGHIYTDYDAKKQQVNNATRTMNGMDNTVDGVYQYP